MTAFTHTSPGTTAESWRADRRWPRLPRLTFDAETCSRVVVVAAHPDDESLGAGGLIATASRAGLDVDIVVLTDGERSHPHSPTTSDELGALRRSELARATSLLAPHARLTHGGLADGRVREHEDDVARRLVELLGDGRSTLLVAPLRGDGHPDHEATGRAAATASARTGATLWEYPIWLWHWASPDDFDWEAAHAVALDDVAIVRKRDAVAAHASQVLPLSAAPGDEALLGPAMLAHFEGGEEVYLLTGAEDSGLDRLHRDAADPWGVDRRWYEQRKRAVLLAALPAQHYRRGLEVGCSTGALSLALAPRCDELLAFDSSPAAVRAASKRLADVANVRVHEASLPQQWPAGELDLVVVSEVGYFLSPAALDVLVERVRESLSADGTVVLCHWRHRVTGWVLDGPDVHATFLAASLGEVLVDHCERDFELLVLGHPDRVSDPMS